MPWIVYMIECGDGSIYTGITNNLHARFEKHKAGRAAKYTRGRGPLTIVWYKCVANKSEALKEEAAIKKLTKSAKEKLIHDGVTKPENGRCWRSSSAVATVSCQSVSPKKC